MAQQLQNDSFLYTTNQNFYPVCIPRSHIKHRSEIPSPKSISKFYFLRIGKKSKRFPYKVFTFNNGGISQRSPMKQSDGDSPLTMLSSKIINFPIELKSDEAMFDDMKKLKSDCEKILEKQINEGVKMRTTSNFDINKLPIALGHPKRLDNKRFRFGTSCKKLRIINNSIKKEILNETKNVLMPSSSAANILNGRNYTLINQIGCSQFNKTARFFINQDHCYNNTITTNITELPFAKLNSNTKSKHPIIKILKSNKKNDVESSELMQPKIKSKIILKVPKKKLIKNGSNSNLIGEMKVSKKTHQNIPILKVKKISTNGNQNDIFNFTFGRLNNQA